MTSPLNLNLITKPTNVELKALGPLKVDNRVKHNGFVTVALDIELDGKKYTVRRFIDERLPFIKGKAETDIIADGVVQRAMLDMVEKMVNIGIAYNLGRAKSDGRVIKEIVLEGDHHTIARRYGDETAEKDLKAAIPVKFRKYSLADKKLGNEKKFEALAYLNSLYGNRSKIEFEDTADDEDELEELEGKNREKVDDVDKPKPSEKKPKTRKLSGFKRARFRQALRQKMKNRNRSRSKQQPASTPPTTQASPKVTSPPADKPAASSTPPLASITADETVRKELPARVEPADEKAINPRIQALLQLLLQDEEIREWLEDPEFQLEFLEDDAFVEELLKEFDQRLEAKLDAKFTSVAAPKDDLSDEENLPLPPETIAEEAPKVKKMEKHEVDLDEEIRELADRGDSYSDDSEVDRLVAEKAGSLATLETAKDALKKEINQFTETLDRLYQFISIVLKSPDGYVKNFYLPLEEFVNDPNFNVTDYHDPICDLSIQLFSNYSKVELQRIAYQNLAQSDDVDPELHRALETVKSIYNQLPITRNLGSGPINEFEGALSQSKAELDKILKGR